MIVGIDLDNTIINYTNSFKYCLQKTKKIPVIDKKNIMNAFENNNYYPIKILLKNQLFDKQKYKIWESIQGKVYGEYINHAEIYKNFYDFLVLCKYFKVKIFIISHKTTYGHNDKLKINLRKVALNFLINKNILKYIPKSNIFFAPTIDEKIDIINKLNCDFFIDDKIEILKHTNINKKIKKILFDNNAVKINKFKSYNWRQVSKKIFKLNFEQLLVKSALKYYKNIKLSKIDQIYKGVNSSVYSVKIKSKKYAVKIYPYEYITPESRLLNEKKSLEFLNFTKIQKLDGKIISFKYNNISLIPWVYGKKVIKMKDEYLYQFIDLLKKLKKNSNVKTKNQINFNRASASCLSFNDIKNQILNRYDKVKTYNSVNKFLKNFIYNKLQPSIYQFINYAEKNWPYSKSINLKKKYQTLSPSDFGLHNAIISEKKIFFIDFEYFGWDDPVKLTCDFILHPKNNLSLSKSIVWREEMEKIYSNDKFFSKRLNLSFFLYGICWVMICLNQFKDYKGKKLNQKLKNQIKIANNILVKLNKEFKELKNEKLS